MRLTDSMIRVTNASIGADGHAVRERPFVVYIHGHLTLKDKRGNQRRFGSRGTAYTVARTYIAEHNQRELQLCPCVASMGCLCACHAAGMDANEPCDTSEERARRIAARPVGICEFCEARDVPLVATLDADPDQRVCAACHADPRVPTTETP